MISRRILLGFGASATFVVRDATPARASMPPPNARPVPSRVAGQPLVFLDPGHGGKDPGAIGVSGTFEKHVALAAAHELQRQLQASGRYRVRLSRAGDVFIPLEQRVTLATAQGAALFVSMHADAVADHAVRGASVYTLAEHASDAQTEALARRENAADRFAGPDLPASMPPEIQHILASLVRRETRARSARMARDVVATLGRDVGLLDNPARHAGFVVLQSPEIPSVLVEMGFMSNPQDEAALQRADHRALVATALHRAIDQFFAGSQPEVKGGARMDG
jgi:N-acetylmuramoyl-L-alanine amidase